MADEPLKVIVVCGYQTAEMQPAFDAVRRHFSKADLRVQCCLDSLERLINGGEWFPDLVVVCQHHPAQYSESHVQKAFGLAPLARWVCVFGAWCESDGHSGTPFPNSVRVPARCAESRIRSEKSVLEGKRPALPLTASRDETFAFDCSKNLTVVLTGRQVEIISPDHELSGMFRDLLIAAGYRAVLRLPPEGAVAAVVWDIDPWSEETAGRLRTFHNDHPNVVIVALMTFAHPENDAILAECGADAVLAKLTAPLDLLPTLKDALSRKALRCR